MNSTPPLPAKALLKKRSASRLMAIQALYQAMQGYGDIEELAADFSQGGLSRFLKYEGIEGDLTYFNAILAPFVGEDLSLFDEKISSFLTHPWHVDRLEPLLLAILRLGASELWKQSDVSTPLILNEYVTLAHGFFSRKEPALVHAVLDKLACLFRP